MRRRIRPLVFVTFCGAFEMSLSTSKAARNKDTGQSAMPLRLSEGPAKTTYQVTFRVCPTFHTVPAVGYVTGGTNTSEVERDASFAPRTGCMASARSAATGASLANMAVAVGVVEGEMRVR